MWERHDSRKFCEFYVKPLPEEMSAGFISAVMASSKNCDRPAVYVFKTVVLDGDVYAYW